MGLFNVVIQLGAILAVVVNMGHLLDAGMGVRGERAA